jgi:perosamine synthetase
VADRIPWFGPEIGLDERHRVAAVLESGYINDGAVTRELEAVIAARVHAKYCVAVTSGTAALALALMALGIGPGDEVIVPDLTFIATANAVRLAGAKVRLVDVTPPRLTIDVVEVEKAIGPNTRAIVPVDVNGRSCAYGPLEALCKAYDLAMVCDSAEAFGSGCFGRFLGTFGDAGVFSFSANKTVSSGQGGCVVTNREDVYGRLRELKDQGRRQGGSGGDDLHPANGYNFKLTNVQAAIALGQLSRLDVRLLHFCNRERWYREELGDVPGLSFLSPRPGEIPQWTDVFTPRRLEVRAALKENGIGYRAFWFPLHKQLPYEAPDAGFEDAISASQQGLWLPSNFSLTRDNVREVAQVIRNALAKGPQ